VFEEVTKREGGKRAAHRASYLLASTAAQAAALAAAGFLCSGIRARLAEGPIVPVKIIRSALPPAAPLRPSGPRAGAERPTPAPAPPKAPLTSPIKHPAPRPPPPRATVPPERGPPELEPAASAPPEEPAADGDADGGERGGGTDESAAGVIGGVAGGTSSSSGPGVEEAPAYPGAGWRRPEQAQRDCVQNSVRIPSSLRGFVQGPVTAKFAIGPDGAPSSFQLIGNVPDARIRAAIWQAVRSCRWIAGSDAQGHPAKLWVIMPIRFEAG